VGSRIWNGGNLKCGFFLDIQSSREAAEKTFLVSVDSMSIMQKGQNNIGLEETSQSQHQMSGATREAVQPSQQHDTQGTQPMQDDTSVLSFQDSITMQTVQSDMNSVTSEVDTLRAQMKTLKSGQVAILAALNCLQKPAGSVHTSTGTDPSILIDESGGPRTTGQG
jgi:hypothetical protein